MVNQNDRETLRRLAGELAEIAQRPKEQEKIRCWKALNGLKPERPMVWITEIPWEEVEDKVEDLKPICTDPASRRIERRLRHRLFTAKHLPCDEVVVPEVNVPKAIRGADYGVVIEEEQIEQGKSSIQAHHYKPAIKDFEDIEKIKMPDIYHDVSESERRRAFYEDLFSDILEIKLTGRRQ